MTTLLLLGALVSAFSSCTYKDNAEQVARSRIQEAIEHGLVNRGMSLEELSDVIGSPDRVVTTNILIYGNQRNGQQEYIGFTANESGYIVAAMSGGFVGGVWCWGGSQADESLLSWVSQDVAAASLSEEDLRSRLGEPAAVVKLIVAYFASFRQFGGEVLAFAVTLQGDRVLDWYWAETDV